MRWMHLSLRAPLAAFGGEAIDARGVTRDFPSQSMLTGLLANALGWSRAMRQEHQRLQSRIVYGAVREHEPVLGRMTDYQTAQLAKDDRAWTTRGIPGKRDGGPATYEGAHQRWRDYHADLRMSVVLSLTHRMTSCQPWTIWRRHSCAQLGRCSSGANRVSRPRASSRDGSTRWTCHPHCVRLCGPANRRFERCGRRQTAKPMPISSPTSPMSATG